MRASRRRKLEQKMRQEGRLPPGQSLTLKFPILHYGSVPEANLEAWTLSILGLVDEETVWSWEEFLKLPTKKVTCDIHCVTRWSKFDTTWEGMPFGALVDLVGVRPEARFVITHCEHGYTTNLPLKAMLEDGVLLAYR